MFLTKKNNFDKHVNLDKNVNFDHFGQKVNFDDIVKMAQTFQ